MTALTRTSFRLELRIDFEKDFDTLKILIFCSVFHLQSIPVWCKISALSMSMLVERPADDGKFIVSSSKKSAFSSEHAL